MRKTLTSNPRPLRAALVSVVLLGLLSILALPPNAFGVVYPKPALENQLQQRQSLQQTQKAPPNYQLTRGKCGTDITCHILIVLNWIVDFLILITYPLGEAFFKTMVTYSFAAFASTATPFMVATTMGWNIVSGVMNMFFVLLLLWMAIATIFDFEMFSARKLLPKLIIAALLINFSLPIGRSIIGLSHGIAKIFWDQINVNMGSFSGAVTKIFDPTEIALAIQNRYVMDKDQAKKILKESTTTIELGYGLGFLSYFLPTAVSSYLATYTAEDCYNIVTKSVISDLLSFPLPTAVTTLWQCEAFLTDVKVATALAAFDPEYGKTAVMAGAFVAKVFMAPIALFAIFAGAIMLLIRLVSLLMLLVFGPFAFFCLIIPPLQTYWSQWWEKLFRWSFFFPVFLFLFMLSLIITGNISTTFLRVNLPAGDAPDIGILLMNYLVGIGLLIGALLVGNQMAIMGAGAITGVGKRMGKGVGRWTANRGWKYAGRAAGAVMGTRAGAVLARVPVLGAGVRAGATTVIKKGAGVETKDIEFYSKLSNRELARQFGSRAIPPHLRQEIYRSFNARRRQEFATEAERQGINLQDLVGTATWRQREFPRIFGQPPTVTPAPPPPQPPPTPAQLQQIQNQTIQTQLMQSLQGLLTQLPPQLQTAASQGIQQGIQNLPRGVQAPAATQAVNQAIQNTIPTQAPANQLLLQATLQSRSAQAQIQQVTAQAVQAAEQAVQQAGQRAQAAARPAQTVEELWEEIERLRSELEEEREERRRGGGG